MEFERDAGARVGYCAASPRERGVGEYLRWLAIPRQGFVGIALSLSKRE
jgi:hypothetical protein